MAYVSPFNFESQHDEMVHDVQMDSEGKLIATCSSDHTIKVFKPTGEPESPYTCVTTLKGHQGPVWQISWSHSKYGNMIASASYDQKVIVWKEQQQHNWQQHHTHSFQGSVNAVCWAPHEHGLCLAAASSDGSVAMLVWTSAEGPGRWHDIIWHAHDGGCTGVSWAPYLPTGSILFDSATMQSGSQRTLSRRLVTCGVDNRIIVWKYADTPPPGNWAKESTLTGHTDMIRDVKWAPNIGLPFTWIASCSEDRTVRVWTQRHDQDNWKESKLPDFPSAVCRVSWSELGNILAISCADATASLWRFDADNTEKWIQMTELTPP